MRQITAIIPVRAGSTRLKNKNIAPFAGTNLLVNKINQLKQVKEITSIVVSSDSDVMLAMAKAAGAMFYVVVEELIPEASSGQHSNLSTIGFAIGFVLMMVLDVVMG